jgi:regulator of replication initiation timing
VWPEAEPNRIKPMELLNTALQTPFVWGLLLGLLITGFVWKSGFSARRNLAREIKRLEAEIKDMQKHLNTQLKINASGNETLQTELDLLRLQNENLRVNNAAMSQKPGRAEMRLLQVHEVAIRTMREQAPGFAAAWENAMRQGEAELDEADSGLKKLMRRVIPGLASPQAPVKIESRNEAEGI